MAKKSGSNEASVKAGRGSTIQQASRDINNNFGLGYEDIVAIAREQAKEYVDAAMEKAVPHAINTANDKANGLAYGLAKRYKDRQEDLIEAFSDPSFFYTWQSAVKSVIRGDKPITEKIIVDVIENRIENKGKDRIELITDAAIEAASKISDNGLKGIAAVWLLAMVYPMYAPISLEFHISRFEVYWRLVTEKYGLPTKGNWLDDISILGLARIHDSGISDVSPFFDVIKKHFKVYLCPGVSNEQYEELVKQIRKVDARIDQFFQPHPLRDQYMLLTDVDDERLRSVISVKTARMAELQQLIDASQIGKEDSTAVSRLQEKLGGNKNYVQIEDWWRNHMKPMSMTSVGKVIAYSYTKEDVSISDIKNLSDLIEL